MLTQKTIDIVKSTAPVLAEKGTEITTVFYKNMFASNPELLNIFNHANQKQGRQQTALANTVYAAAKYIDQLHVLLPAVKQIAHKHRSLVIKPEHYPIVGENLLGAIKEVLGDAATDEIIGAWAEAYGVIADVFISVEEEMYQEAANQNGGWREFKEFKVVKKEQESENITSFYLQPVDGSTVPDFKPGQYITVRVQIPGETYLMNRQYSLSAAPGEEYFRISVKREQMEGTPDGKVSNYLHDAIEEGNTLDVTAPAGDFVLLENDAPIYFFAGGVGITPFMSMLNDLKKKNPNKIATLIHSVRNKDLHAFEQEIESIADGMEKLGYTFLYEIAEGNLDNPNVQEGRVTKQMLQGMALNQQAHYYVCGPVGFMKAVILSLKDLGIKDENIHFEFFGPSMNLEAETVKA
ncbi:NO-inducible flavohemoprotein [Peribacillus alkalitolerans]|uniref:NO-inducible flavohemoprotein n=1 Tax=Peribacillus alkalitolerans TaxID=1550385 RepID=UPI0013D17D43|nr:NO-inducible flavohemoprotein [Peribacillus alkalitolerans]